MQFSLLLEPRGDEAGTGPEPRLRRLLEVARRNEQAWRRFQDFQIALMESEDLHGLARTLEHHARRHFDWSCVQLHLLDGSAELAQAHRLLESAPHPALSWLSDSVALTRLYPQDLRPLLDRFRSQTHGHWLPRASINGVESVALLPLIRRGEWLGLLAIGARTAGRFRPGMATDFLEGLATTLTTCVDAARSRALLRCLGLTDALTGLGNRRLFDRRLQEECLRAARQQQPLACLLIDIDHFKAINDRHGHPAGDAVLRTLSERLGCELGSAGMVARFGGEEFAVLLAGSDLERSTALAERLRNCIAAAPVAAAAEEIPVTASLGVAVWAPGAGTDAAACQQTLLATADAALYAAKRNGRNRVEVAA